MPWQINDHDETLVFQNAVEASVISGRQRVASAILTVNAGTTNYIGFRTGANPVTIYSRLINQIGSTRIEYSARSKLSFTGNITANVINLRNPNQRVQQPITTLAWHSVTPGTPDGNTETYLDPFPIFASGNNAQTRLGSDTLGLEYPLEANTDHVFAIANPGTGNATVHWWITFSEDLT